MRPIKPNQLIIIAIFYILNVQAQNIPENSVVQPVPINTPYTTYSAPSAPPVATQQQIVIQPTQTVVMPQGVVVPPGVVYVAPTYPAPAVGFVWSYHPRFGWGWHHPNRGWHRGWR